MKKGSFDSISKIVTQSLPQAPKIDPKSPNLGAKIAEKRQKCGEKRISEASIFRAKKRSEKNSKKPLARNQFGVLLFKELIRPEWSDHFCKTV